MPVKALLLLVVVVSFALSAGGANFAASFGAACGSGVVRRKEALLLFTLFVTLGAVLLGGFVGSTLSGGIVPARAIDFSASLVIIAAAMVSLSLANLLKIPQSTSLITVGAILGVGLGLGQINIRTFLFLIPMWVILPLAGYLSTLCLGRFFYPPRHGNLRLYEKMAAHEGKLKAFVMVSSCYDAFAIGTNNVANIVGPLAGGGVVNSGLGFLLIAPLFGLGGVFFRGAFHTAGKEIVPLGTFTAALTCFIPSTLMITASAMGVPQSFVHLKMASIFAVASLKDGHGVTVRGRLARKTLATWTISPLLSVAISYLLFRGIK